MSESPLARHAGPIALVAGAFFAVTHVTLLIVMDRSDLQAMVADPVFRVVNAAYAAAFSGLVIALVAAYARQARQAGTFGLVALCAAIVGTVNLGADMWFEAFATPWLAEVVPQVLTAEKTLIWKIGYLSSYVLSLRAGCCSGSPASAPGSFRSRSASPSWPAVRSGSWRRVRRTGLPWAWPSYGSAPG